MKRQRESAVGYQIKDKYVILTCNGMHYVWYPPIKGSIDTFLNQQTFEYEIIYTNTGQAVFNVENLRTNTDVLSQIVDPIPSTG